MKRYHQLIEGHQDGFMFTLRACNHETILQSGVYWSRQAALDAVAAVRVYSQDLGRYARRENIDGRHHFKLLEPSGKTLARSAGCSTRGGLSAGLASVQRNAPSTTFRGLIRRNLTMGSAVD